MCPSPAQRRFGALTAFVYWKLVNIWIFYDLAPRRGVANIPNKAQLEINSPHQVIFRFYFLNYLPKTFFECVLAWPFIECICYNFVIFNFAMLWLLLEAWLTPSFSNQKLLMLMFDFTPNQWTTKEKTYTVSQLNSRYLIKIKIIGLCCLS